MGQTAVVTVRIKREIKDALEKAGVNIPSVIRQHLEELAWRLQLKEETEKMSKLLEDVKPSEREFAVKSVKEDRESH
jgi:antitoxin component of RelBE/YafQ-DinJ toxin-antitoxin module